MATKQTIMITCDYPGCGKRITELGGRMVLTIDGPGVQADATGDQSADLCREHRRQLEAWWSRKAGEAITVEERDEDERDEDTTTAAPRGIAS